MIKFMIAKQSFKSRLVSADIKDVLEQYQAGHSNVLYRIKDMQNDLDTLMGKVGTNAKKVQESRTSLMSRIDKIENMNKDIEERLDNQIEYLKKIHLQCLSIRSSNDIMRDRDISSSFNSRQRSKSEC